MSLLELKNQNRQKASLILSVRTKLSSNTTILNKKGQRKEIKEDKTMLQINHSELTKIDSFFLKQKGI
jgi:hypothetical protein